MIKGNKIGLRAVELQDLEQLRLWRNNPNLRKFFRETQEINQNNQMLWYESISQKNSIHKMFSIIDLETNTLLGACGLCYIDWINRNADFSIYIGYKDLYIDNEFATDAAKLLIQYGFDVLNLHRLWAEIYSLDTEKKALFETLNFTLDGIHRQTYWYEKTWHNSLFFSLLSTD